MKFKLKQKKTRFSLTCQADSRVTRTHGTVKTTRLRFVASERWFRCLDRPAIKSHTKPSHKSSQHMAVLLYIGAPFEAASCIKAQEKTKKKHISRHSHDSICPASIFPFSGLSADSSWEPRSAAAPPLHLIVHRRKTIAEAV